MSNSDLKFNINYFDEINSADKAYWIGFIWCDGYLGIRHRNNRRTEYNLKLSLKKDDYTHLEKFNECINGKYKVNFYKFKSFDNKESMECRLFITNQYLGKVLSNKYLLVPHRNDCSKLLQNIPERYSKDFIRGILDADGSFSTYICNDNQRLTQKYIIQFGGNEQLLKWIEQIFIKEQLINNIERKLSHRHPDRDETFRTLTLSGKKNVTNILNWLYQNSNIYLERKYIKYLKIIKGGDDYLEKK